MELSLVTGIVRAGDWLAAADIAWATVIALVSSSPFSGSFFCILYKSSQNK